MNETYQIDNQIHLWSSIGKETTSPVFWPICLLHTLSLLCLPKRGERGPQRPGVFQLFCTSLPKCDTDYAMVASYRKHYHTAAFELRRHVNVTTAYMTSSVRYIVQYWTIFPVYIVCLNSSLNLDNPNSHLPFWCAFYICLTCINDNATIDISRTTPQMYNYQPLTANISNVRWFWSAHGHFS